MAHIFIISSQFSDKCKRQFHESHRWANINLAMDAIVTAWPLDAFSQTRHRLNNECTNFEQNFNLSFWQDIISERLPVFVYENSSHICIGEAETATVTGLKRYGGALVGLH